MPKKVLIVEDNELNMKLFSDLLDAHGFETEQTREGLKAISIAKEFRPDLILMDIQLPEVSGLEVTKWIKDDKSLSNIPIIAVTAFRLRGLYFQANQRFFFPGYDPKIHQIGGLA